MSMMSLFISTICISSIIKIINKIKINNDIKNAGYKIKSKSKKLKQTSNTILLFPIINIIMVLKDMIKYNINKEKIFKDLIENKNLIKIQSSKENMNKNEINQKRNNTDYNVKNDNDIYNKPLNEMNNIEKIQALKKLKEEFLNEEEQNISKNKTKIK